MRGTGLDVLAATYCIAATSVRCTVKPVLSMVLLDVTRQVYGLEKSRAVSSQAQEGGCPRPKCVLDGQMVEANVLGLVVYTWSISGGHCLNRDA